MNFCFVVIFSILFSFFSAKTVPPSRSMPFVYKVLNFFVQHFPNLSIFCKACKCGLLRDCKSAGTKNSAKGLMAVFTWPSSILYRLCEADGLNSLRTALQTIAILVTMVALRHRARANINHSLPLRHQAMDASRLAVWVVA